MNHILSDLLHQSGARPDDPLTLKHPFLCDAIQGNVPARELLRRTERALTVPPRSTLAFAQDGLWASVWQGEFDGHEIEGVTVVLRRDTGLEVRVMVREFSVTSLWRAQVRRLAEELLPSAAWELPDGTDQSIPPAAPDQVVDAHLPFPLAEGVVFHSPVLARPVQGAKLVAEVIGNAAAVYGARTNVTNAMNGRNLLSLWTVEVSAVPVESATLVHFDEQKRAESITVLMQPWPAVKLFRDRVRVRAAHLLDEAYFELA